MTLTKKDFEDAAAALGCKPAAVYAVTVVESRGEGFDDDGRIILRFEGHCFRDLTGRRFDKSNPNVSYPYAQMGRKQHGYEAFNEAFALDPVAAMEACSWGMFQIMGFNHKMCGFADVGAMVDYLKQGEDEQLLAFVKFIRARGLADEMQNCQWAKFAMQYNGAGYRKNNYDVKLAKAFAAYK